MFYNKYNYSLYYYTQYLNNYAVNIKKGVGSMEEKSAKKKGFPKWAKILIIVFVVIIIIGLASGNEDSSSNNSSNNNGTTNKNKTQEKFTLLEVTSAAPDDYNFAYYIEGSIKNNMDKDYDYVQVEFTTYDADGNTLGTCLDNNSGLEANGTWKFKAMCTDNVEQIASYKLKEITGW